MIQVSELKSKNGGGNKKAKKLWLADYENAKKAMPKKGDDLNKYKDFIKKVYEQKKFYKEGADEEEEDEEESPSPKKERAATPKEPKSPTVSEDFDK